MIEVAPSDVIGFPGNMTCYEIGLSLKTERIETIECEEHVAIGLQSIGKKRSTFIVNLIAFNVSIVIVASIVLLVVKPNSPIPRNFLIALITCDNLRTSEMWFPSFDKDKKTVLMICVVCTCSHDSFKFKFVFELVCKLVDIMDVVLY